MSGNFLCARWAVALGVGALWAASARAEIGSFVFSERGEATNLGEFSYDRELIARPLPFAEVETATGDRVAPVAFERCGERLKFDFAAAGKLEIDQKRQGNCWTFEIVRAELPGAAALFVGQFAPVMTKYRGTKVNGLSDDTHALVVRAFEATGEMGTSADRVWIRYPAAHGFLGRRFGLAAGTRAETVAALKTMTVEAQVPVSVNGGAWSLESEANRESYMMAWGIAAKNTDEWIERTKMAGFKTLHYDWWWVAPGQYLVNPERFPTRLDGLAESVAKAKAAGLRGDIHTLTGMIGFKDPWIHPQTVDNLIVQARYTLATPLSAEATELVVNEQPIANHATILNYSSAGNVLWLDGELVQYTKVERERPPYRFCNLTRGALGTKAAAHPRNGRCDYLWQRYDGFFAEPASPLGDELAAGIAKVYATCGFEKIYFDGSEGTRPDWKCNQMQEKIYRAVAATGKVPIVEDSRWGSHTWWYHSNIGAWDVPHWGPKRHFYRHVVSTPEFRKTDFLAPQMGWWGIIESHPAGRAFFAEEHEYAFAKNAAVDGAFSMFVSKDEWAKTPYPYLFSERMYALVGNYERPRLARAFAPGVLEKLLPRDDEFHLDQDEQGNWQFTPLAVEGRRLPTPDTRSWQAQVKYSSPAKLRVEALYEADLAHPGEVLFAGTNRLRSAHTVLSSFPAPYKDLSKTLAFGAWVKGDGSGAHLNLELVSAKELGSVHSMHYLKLDFVGWKFVTFLLRERDTAQFDDYRPYGNEDIRAYGVFHRPLPAQHVGFVEAWIHGVEDLSKTAIEVGPITAYPVVPGKLESASVKVGDTTLRLPWTLKSGEFAEFENGVWTKYDDYSCELERCRRAERLALKAGAVNCELVTAQASSRAEVSLFTYGQPFAALADRLSSAQRRCLGYEAMNPLWWDPEHGFDECEPVKVRPGETATLTVRAWGPTQSFQLQVGGRTLECPALAEGETRQLRLAGIRGVNPVKVVRCGSPTLRLRLIKEYDEPATVFRGVNFIDRPITLTPADSGREFVGEDGAVICGGIRLQDWKAVGDGVWEIEAPRTADGSAMFVDQLWVNGERRPNARVPSAGYLSLVGPVVETARTNAEGQVVYSTRVCFTNELVKALAAVPAAELADVQLSAIVKWSYCKRPVLAFDPAKRELLTESDSPLARWKFWDEDSLFYLENVRSGFEAPGEWFFDRAAGKIRYRPKAGEDLANCQVFVPRRGLSRLVEFRGDPATGKLVENVTFRNLKFEYSDATVTSGGNGPQPIVQLQAARSSDGTIDLTGARNCRFEHCLVAHTGNYAMRFDDGCMSNSVVNCILEDTGAGGIWMGERQNRAAAREILYPDSALATAYNLISNCVIRQGGRYNPEGTGVALTHCSDTKVVDCDIYDQYYSGVSVGYVWGYRGSVAQRNEIARNRIWDLGKGIMSDMGGVYMLATSFGSSVHDNVIHDVRSRTYGGWALYCDEGSEGITMERNLCWNTTDGGFHQHYGVGCVIRNNIFAWNRELGAVRVKFAEHARQPGTVHFYNNIVLIDRGSFTCASPGTMGREGSVWYGNLWYDARGIEYADFGGMGWERWRAYGKDRLSQFADPRFEDARAFDFRLKADSPALALGFRPWDYSVAGCKQDKAKEAK